MPKKSSQNWSIRRLRGAIPWLKTQIADAKDPKYFTGELDEHWKECLCDALGTLDPKYNVATIDAHAQIHDGSTASDPKEKKADHSNPATPPLINLNLSIVPETIGGM